MKKMTCKKRTFSKTRMEHDHYTLITFGRGIAYCRRRMEEGDESICNSFRTKLKLEKAEDEAECNTTLHSI